MKKVNASLSRVRALLGRIWNMLIHPRKTCEAVRKERFEETLKYFLILLLIPALILLVGGAAVYSWLLASFAREYQFLGWTGVVLVLPFFLATAFFALLLSGLILHLFVLLLGGKQGLSQTYKALAYGSTPLILSIWFVPLVAITAIWSLVLIGMGIRDLQKMSNFRATICTLLPLALVLALASVVTVLL